MTRNRFYTWEKYKDLNSFTLNRDKSLFKKEFVKIHKDKKVGEKIYSKEIILDEAS